MKQDSKFKEKNESGKTKKKLSKTGMSQEKTKQD